MAGAHCTTAPLHQCAGQLAPDALPAERRIDVGVVHDDRGGVGAAAASTGKALAAVFYANSAVGVLLLVLHPVRHGWMKWLAGGVRWSIAQRFLPLWSGKWAAPSAQTLAVARLALRRTQALGRHPAVAPSRVSPLPWPYQRSACSPQTYPARRCRRRFSRPSGLARSESSCRG